MSVPVCSRWHARKNPLTSNGAVTKNTRLAEMGAKSTTVGRHLLGKAIKGIGPRPAGLQMMETERPFTRPRVMVEVPMQAPRGVAPVQWRAVAGHGRKRTAKSLHVSLTLIKVGVGSKVIKECGLR